MSKNHINAWLHNYRSALRGFSYSGLHAQAEPIRWNCCKQIKTAFYLPIIVLLVGTSGCVQNDMNSPANPEFHSPMSVSAPEVELQEALAGFEEYFEAAVKQAANEIDNRESDKKILKAALLWKISMISANHAVLKQKNPLKALTDAWILTERMALYFEQGQGRELFGMHQDIAVAISTHLATEMEQIGKRFLPEYCFIQGGTSIRKLARDNPIVGVFDNAIVYAPLSGGDGETGFHEIMRVKFSLFPGAAEIDRGVTAINEFTGVADRFTDVADKFPEAIRWQLMLMLYEMEDVGIVQSLEHKLADILDNSQHLAMAAEQFPQQIGSEVLNLTDNLAWRAAQLIILTFVLVMAYRFICKGKGDSSLFFSTSTRSSPAPKSP